MQTSTNKVYQVICTIQLYHEDLKNLRKKKLYDVLLGVSLCFRFCHSIVSVLVSRYCIQGCRHYVGIVTTLSCTKTDMLKLRIFSIKIHPSLYSCSILGKKSEMQLCPIVLLWANVSFRMSDHIYWGCSAAGALPTLGQKSWFIVASHYDLAINHSWL